MAIMGRDWIAEVEATLDSAQYADNDLLFNPIEIAGAIDRGGASEIRSISVVDYDDQGATMTLLFFGENPGTLGTLNAAFAITDAQAAACLGFVLVDTYDDIGAQQIGTEANVSLMVRPTDGGTSIWVAAVSGGTGTYASRKVTVRVGLERR